MASGPGWKPLAVLCTAQVVLQLDFSIVNVALRRPRSASTARTGQHSDCRTRPAFPRPVRRPVGRPVPGGHGRVAARRPVARDLALLASVAALSGDQVLRKRVHREITERAHPLPAWLAGMPSATATQRRDAESSAGHPRARRRRQRARRRRAARPAGAHRGGLHRPQQGQLVKDAFVVPEPLDDVALRPRTCCARSCGSATTSGASGPS